MVQIQIEEKKLINGQDAEAPSHAHVQVQAPEDPGMAVLEAMVRREKRKHLFLYLDLFCRLLIYGMVLVSIVYYWSDESMSVEYAVIPMACKASGRRYYETAVMSKDHVSCSGPISVESPILEESSNCLNLDVIREYKYHCSGTVIRIHGEAPEYVYIGLFTKIQQVLHVNEDSQGGPNPQ